MPISAPAITSLRTRTGVSILACKEALEEAGGDEEKAIEILRKRGIAQAAKKAQREQHEGRVFMEEMEGKAAMGLLRCETDFVARDDAFIGLGTSLVHTLLMKGEEAVKQEASVKLPEIVQKLGENITAEERRLVVAPVLGTYLHTNAKIGVIVGLSAGTREMARDAAMHAAALNPIIVSPEDMDTALVEKEKEIWREQMKKDGKPEAMWDKIMMGKERKFREENALLKQPFVKDPGKTVEQYLGGAKVTAYVRLSIS